jgi:hypothetical protein
VLIAVVERVLAPALRTGHDALMFTRVVVAVAFALTACGTPEESGAAVTANSSQPHSTREAISATTDSAASSVAGTVPTDSEIGPILGAAVRAAVEQNPGDQHGVDQGQAFVVADALGEVGDTDLGVRFDRTRQLLSDADRAAIATAMLPGSITFTSADSDTEMWQLAQPDVRGDSAVVTYQHHCGGGANMCDSGGAFRLERRDGNWQAVEMMRNWIA